MSYPTSRRYPRSLAEAWPNEYANPIQGYKSAYNAASAVWAIVLIVLCFVIVWGIVK